MSPITKVIFPVAGLGTRFLPATKASPKEMLPIVDKPLIQYAVEEAIEAGITEMIFVTGRNKQSIANHFDKAYELENELSYRGKKAMLEIVQNIVPDHVTCVYTRQPEALGLGHAILCAKQIVSDAPFAVILADDLIDARPGVLSQMIEQYAHFGSSIIGVQNIPRKEASSYGIVDAQPIEKAIYKLKGIVEKPQPADAPSTLAVVGRYILTPEIFVQLEEIGPGAGGEFQLTDAIAALLDKQPVYAYEFAGKRYDCGSKLGYLEATVEYGLRHPELSAEFRYYLKSLNLS